MEVSEMTIEAPQGTDAPGSQPAFQPEPKFDEAQVRAAIEAQEAKGLNPLDVTVGDLAQGAAPKLEPTAPVDVPVKFQKPTGEVDVEKLKASTMQLDQAIAQKEVALQKSVDDYIREYQQKEARFKNMPNPQNLPASLSQAPAPAEPAQMSDQQLEALINRDFQANPAGTMAQLIEIALQRRLQPFEQDKQVAVVRGNIAELVKKDSRVLHPQVFAAINAKLDADPDLWKLKNPHKAAWLEVKEDLRLGDSGAQAPGQAQPSRTASPILGGGSPPPAPSSSSANVPTYQSLNEAIVAVQSDPKLRRDPNVTQKLDQAAKAFFDRVYR